MSSTPSSSRPRARLAGDAVMEVMLQMRPNGRCLDHYRIALDGTVLETQVNATRAGPRQVQAHLSGVASRPQDQAEYDNYRLGGQLHRYRRQQHLGLYRGEG
jgi:hypothetical protein